MYLYLIGALAVLGVLVAAGAVLSLVAYALGHGQRARLQQRKDVAILRGQAQAAEIETSMALHQLEQRRDVLMNPNGAKELPVGLPEDYFEVAHEGKVVGSEEPTAKFYCATCGATYIRKPPPPPRRDDVYGERPSICRARNEISNKVCGGRIEKIETAKVVS